MILTNFKCNQLLTLILHCATGQPTLKKLWRFFNCHLKTLKKNTHTPIVTHERGGTNISNVTKIHRIRQNTVSFPSPSSAKFIDYQIMQEAADIDLTADDEIEI